MESVAPPAAGAPAIRCAGQARGYPEFLDRAARIATGLAAWGVTPGDRVAVVLRNEPAHLEITTAAAQLGAAAVPVNWHFRQDDLRHVLTDSGSAVVFAHTDLLDAVTAVLPRGCGSSRSPCRPAWRRPAAPPPHRSPAGTPSSTTGWPTGRRWPARRGPPAHRHLQLGNDRTAQGFCANRSARTGSPRP
ncbi:AMP-binding protein [Streptomyces noursei]|nr:AMP-binding protein [Streptomyces noursei]